MEKYGHPSRQDNVDTSFMQRRQEALSQEGVTTPEQIDPRITGADANDIIIEKLRKLNNHETHTPHPILDMILTRVEQLRADNQSEEIVRATLDNLICYHAALLKYLTHPSLNIADLPDYIDPTHDRYNF